MKNFLVLLAFASTIGVASAQKLTATEVPQAVKTAFAKLYPSATDVKWSKEDEKFEAEFKSGKTEQSVLLSANGQLVESEVEIDVKSLPVAAQNYIKKHYPNEPIKEAAKITNAQGAVTYEAELKGKDIIFDATGNFIKETK